MQHTFECETCGKVVKQNVRKDEKPPTKCLNCIRDFRALWGLC